MVHHLNKDQRHLWKRLRHQEQQIVFVGAFTISMILGGCASSNPLLYPSSPSETSPSQVSSALTVLLTPVDTSGFASPAKGQYGLDVSAYFTAFELQLINRSNQPVDFESQEIYMIDDRGKSFPALTEDESIDYYRYGDAGPDGAVVLIAKPLTMVKAEVAQIRRIHLRSATLLPGETHRGVVMFKKLGQDQCRNVHIRIQGITFTDVTQSRDVDIAFSCKD